MPAKGTTLRRPERAAGLPSGLLPALGVFLFFFAALFARPQEPPPAGPPLRVDVRLVNVEVAVTDSTGRLIPDLASHNFRLRENGVPQEVSHFAPTQAPVRVALLVEASPAVFLLQREHLTAAYHLLRALRPEDEVALVSYARSSRQELPFTRDKRRVEERLASLTQFGLGMAEMNLLDAVADTVDWLSPPPQRTAVVVIGTGLDSGSATPWDSLQQRVGASQVTFFTLAVGQLLRGEPKGGKKPSRRDRSQETLEATFASAGDRLRALAEASAGGAYSPQSPEELDRIYAGIAERLRNLYSLGYYPSNTTRDGAYREIGVELVDTAGAPLVVRDAQGRPLPYRIFARPGYFAPRE